MASSLLGISRYRRLSISPGRSSHFPHGDWLHRRCFLDFRLYYHRADDRGHGYDDAHGHDGDGDRGHDHGRGRDLDP